MQFEFPQRRRALLRATAGVFCTATALGLFVARPTCAAEITVKNADEAKGALANAKPGDTLLLENGDYDLGRITLTQTATEGAPLVVRARQAGKARLIGKTGFIFRRAAYVTLNGFDFATEDVPPVEITGSHHVRLTENHFHVKEPGGKGAFRWVRISSPQGDAGTTAPNSHHNRIDHNLFEEKHTIGNYVSVDGNTLPYPQAQISQYDRIDHNHFRNIGPRVPNGMEAIRVGLSGTSLSSGFTVLEDNLFENCDGDPEVVSIKTSDATIRNNVFRSCQGGLCLRHGNRNRVVGNVFIGDGKKGSNGIRMYGDDHVIENNFLSGLKSFALAVTNGDVDYGADYTKKEPLPAKDPDKQILKLHLRPRRITLRKNVVVDCAEAIELGAPYNLPAPQLAAQDIHFEDNTIMGGKSPDAHLVWIRTAPERLTWSGNTLYAGSVAETGLPATVPDISVKVIRGATPSLAVPPRLPKDIGPDWLR